MEGKCNVLPLGGDALHHLDTAQPPQLMQLWCLVCRRQSTYHHWWGRGEGEDSLPILGIAATAAERRRYRGRVIVCIVQLLVSKRSSPGAPALGS